MDTREIVRKYFEYVNSGQWDQYLTLFAPTIVMDEQLAGHLEGIDAVRNSVQGLRDNHDFRNYPHEIVVEGNRALATWHITASQANGAMLEVDGVNFYRIENGLIAYFRNFHDTAPFR